MVSVQEGKEEEEEHITRHFVGQSEGGLQIRISASFFFSKGDPKDTATIPRRGRRHEGGEGGDPPTPRTNWLVKEEKEKERRRKKKKKATEISVRRKR